MQKTGGDGGDGGWASRGVSEGDSGCSVLDWLERFEGATREQGAVIVEE